jgi:hypothetical protein
VKTPEGFLKDRIKQHLNSLPRRYWYMPVPAGYGKQTVDFLCCVDGRFVAIETKAPGKLPTPRQKLALDEITQGGGIAFWCDSFESYKLVMESHGLWA